MVPSHLPLQLIMVHSAQCLPAKADELEQECSYQYCVLGVLLINDTGEQKSLQS